MYNYISYEGTKGWSKLDFGVSFSLGYLEVQEIVVHGTFIQISNVRYIYMKHIRNGILQ